ncbi:MAG: FAD-binding oxidoreductase [Sphingobacteriia bacterium]|nr:MAG: FAD-binding oxidoreductase [Sphingobacteriia bacterium]
MKVDYIIIGQGISGSFLSWNLLKTGKQVLVIDQSISNTASKAASGVINPVTGRRIVQTWEIETLMPYAVEAYTQLGDELGATVINQCNILDFHATPQMKLAFDDRLADDNIYLRKPVNPDQWNDYFHPSFGIGEINPCWLVDIHALLNGWRKKLIDSNLLLEEKFELSNCIIDTDHVEYQNYQAQKIIFCDGIAGFENPYFHLLPYAANKGEAIIASIPGLPDNHIFKQGISMVPWKEGLFWIGSSYEWNYSDTLPTAAFKLKVEQQLKNWLKLPYAIEEHIASVRPANLERRPFVGVHPLHPSVGILNGMGTKGCSLAPYFASALTKYLLENAPIHPLADVQRFKKILSR